MGRARGRRAVRRGDTAARRKAARRPLAIALEAHARALFGGEHADGRLQSLVAAGGLLTRRTHRRSPLARTLRLELLGERAPDSHGSGRPSETRLRLNSLFRLMRMLKVLRPTGDARLRGECSQPPHVTVRGLRGRPRTAFSEDRDAPVAFFRVFRTIKATPATVWRGSLAPTNELLRLAARLEARAEAHDDQPEGVVPLAAGQDRIVSATSPGPFG